MRRRDILVGALALPAAGKLWPENLFPSAFAQDKGQDKPQDKAGQPFDASSVQQQARELAQKPYKAPDLSLPDSLKKLNYDQYRAIRFRPDQALWLADKLPFQTQFFHRGTIFANRVDIYQVRNGRAEPVPYSPSLFSFGDTPPPEPNSNLGFSGFRVHGPLNKPDYYDEIGVFLGATYFRAVARGQVYGLSARGLSINTGNPKGEEFPVFKTYWIEQPAKAATSIVVHGLIDSESASAAVRFTMRPGETTIYDVELTVFPRVQIAEPGIATLTSMFFFGANDRAGVDDFRPAVHDSDGLAIQNGRSEWLWRPLNNPRDLQISTFADNNPRGFGLMQRQRSFGAYEDLESRYERRPSAWIEPIGDWGEGAVHLVEIPTKSEVHDNIGAFWRPKEPLRAKGEYRYTYRIHWGWGAKPGLVPVAQTRIGAGEEQTRLIVLDFADEKLKATPLDQIRADVKADKGEIKDIVLHPNPELGGARLSFRLAPGNESAVELRAQLMRGDTALSEVWVYRWTL
ncbi:MAG: glucan biosynthesis protein [Xanthobacteraceae bacterium]|nr:glucan biosynthesis protein [Xanthobacteraceae bacterium]